MLTDKYLLLSESFASDYMAKVEHYTSPANAGKLDDFLRQHFEEKIAATKNIYRFDGVDAHIFINGPMSPSGPDLYDIFYGFGGVSYVDILGAIEQARKDVDPDRGVLYFHANTPGGTVSMVDDVYQSILSCGLKTVMVNTGMVASGGMWIGSACDVIVASTPAAFTGSIGVIVSAYDITGMLEKMGVKRVVITNHEASEKAPDISTPEGQRVVQDELNAIYSVFKQRVVSGRKGKISELAIDELKGSVKIAAEAVSVGLIDAIVEKQKKSTGKSTSQPRAQATPQPASERKGDAMNLDQLRAEHPDLVAAIEAAAREGYVSAADLQSQIEATAAGERARIQSVEAQLIPGHEALIASLKFDGKTTGPEAAAAVVAAEKGVRTAALAALESDAPPIVPAAEGRDADVDPAAPIEERAKAEWDKSADVRAEFGGKFDAFLAYRKKAEAGGVRILGKK